MADRRTVRALLVEDDQEDVLIFRRYAEHIARYELDIQRVRGEEAARRQVSDGQFDVLFLDLNLRGGGHGLSLLRRLRRSQVDVPPVVVVTGSGDEGKAVEAMKTGAYDYLVKEQLSPDLLERTIRHALERRALERERTEMVEKLAELSVTDELTGIANRRSLQRKMEDEVCRSTRTGRPFSLLMVDLDHFKDVNDTHGHQAGDRVLQACARTLSRSVRNTDVVARYGGEEFCVVLTETALSGAHDAAKKLRRRIASLPEPVPTVSIGAAAWEPGVCAEEIVRRADKAMYRAKRAGRNQVAVWQDNPPAQGDGQPRPAEGCSPAREGRTP
ncbi:MAG: diguanylate cyclase [Candidatus Brocadiia bacterium]